MTYMDLNQSMKHQNLFFLERLFDGTVSYRPGTRFAPAAMRAEFEGLETYSPYFDMDLEAYSLFDGGDLDLPFGSKERALDMIYDTTKKILDDNKIPLMIGGEHLVSYGPMKLWPKVR